MERNTLRTRAALLGAVAALASAPGAAQAQATSRTCSGTAGETPGPACLVAHVDIDTLPPEPLYWRLYTFADTESALRARPPHGAIVQAFGQVWLFDVGSEGAKLPGGHPVAAVGPLPLEAAAGHFSIEYLKSTFSPGMEAPLHVHSGPEAFYVVNGDTCLETPDGAQVGRGAGHALMVRRGPPMLLKAIGKENRRGFALILHESGSPPTTISSSWLPKGLCPAE